VGNAPVGNQDLWFPVGPIVMRNGQAGGHPNVAGRIRDLQVEPDQGKRVYAASAGGGVWFSADRGETWRPLDDWQISDRSNLGNIANALSCGAVYVVWGAQDDGSDDVVWVGTGEPSLTAAGQQALTGIQPGGPQVGGAVVGVGLLNRDPAVAGGAWTIVKGDEPSVDADTLRGESFYRIVADPGTKDQLVAGTTKGLYVKPTGGSWTRVSGLAASVNVQPMDVVVTRSGGGGRIWVAVATQLLAAEFTGAPGTPIDPTTLSFSPVTLTGVFTDPVGSALGTCLQLATDGTTVYVLGRSVIPSGSKRATPPAAIWTIDAAAALALLTGTLLTGTPPDLFMSASDQSAYDICIAAHPTVSGRVYIGGATVSTSTGYNGAIYRCETTATAVAPTLIGEGTHADVHVLRVGAVSPSDNTKRTVWTGTDGGMFRSDADGDNGTFAARNDGLAVLQPGFVANHPTNPGIIVAGFQDNGTAVRVGDGIWDQTFEGDGGGVTFDASSANRYFRQYTLATWQSSDGGGIAPVERRNARPVGNLKTSETIEAESCLFYSGASSVVHGGDTHLALGTDRVWYSRDWGRSWVTLPTASDPRAGDNPDLAQDVLEQVGGNVTYVDRVGSVDCCSTDHAGTGIKGKGVITVRLSVAPNDGSGNLVLRALALYAGGLVWMTGTRASGATGAFAWAPPPLTRQVIKNPVPGSADENDFANGQPLGFLPAFAVVSDVCVHDPARGSLGSCYVTTTGFPYPRAGAAPIPRDTLWFFDGVDKWRPTGLRINHPNGTWAVPTDQVTAPALGVVVDPDDPNTVYVATSVGVVKGVLTIGGTNDAPTYAWAWQQYMNGLPEAAVQDLAIFKGAGVKLLRAATQSRGVWEVDLGNETVTPLSYLRLFRMDTRRVLPTPTGGDLLNGDPNNPTHWDDSPDIVIDATGTPPAVPPSEAQLLAIPSAGPPAQGARVSVRASPIQVHVLAHHRVGDITVPGNQLRVALLRHALPANGVVPIGALWPALVSAAQSNTLPASLPDDWAAAGAVLWLSPTDPIDPRMPRAVTFDVDLSGDAAGTAIVLLAVVLSDSNPISAADLSLGGGPPAQTGDQLVVASPHAAAKSILVL
jgi:hypothetical protein